jgi:DNA (cytosine-5)-methyltransferase 1
VILIGKLNGRDDFNPFPEKRKEKVSSNDVLFDLPKIKAGEGFVKPQQLNLISNEHFLIQSGIRDSKINKVTWHQCRPQSDQDLEIYRIAADLWKNKNTRLKYDVLPTHLKTHKNEKSFLDRFKVVSPHEPSHTVVAHISKDGHYYIHPDQSQNRSLSVREAARLQTFPDSFYFESVSGKPSRTTAFKQIGNAVPVLLAKSLAVRLKAIMYS